MGNSHAMSAERPGYPSQVSHQSTTSQDYGQAQPAAPSAYEQAQQAAGQQRPVAGNQAAPRNPQANGPADTAGMLRGLQAWMADLDRRLSIRTKLLLGLVAVAIGAAGAAIFLSIEANRTTASQREFAELKRDVEQIQQQLGIMPTETELEEATGAAEEAAEEAESAAEEAESAAGSADEAAAEAEGAADQAAEEEIDASSILDEAKKESFDDLDSGAPPMPEIGTD